MFMKNESKRTIEQRYILHNKKFVVLSFFPLSSRRKLKISLFSDMKLVLELWRVWVWPMICNYPDWQRRQIMTIGISKWKPFLDLKMP